MSNERREKETRGKGEKENEERGRKGKEAKPLIHISGYITVFANTTAKNT